MERFRARSDQISLRSKTQLHHLRYVSMENLEPRVLLAGAPIISEFQAINNSTIQDSDGQFEDWIEVANRNATPIELAGWYLTDDDTNLAKWRFPAVTIPANDEIVVFASGKNRIDDVDELHTNFKLSGNGEYLALVHPDGTTVVQDFGSEYPAQFADQSYGLPSDRDQSSPQFFIDPTPGETNSMAAAPQPMLIGQQGVFFGSTVVELVLSEPSDEIEIRYTLDGNEPMSDSPLYTGPITLTESSMLQAKAFGTSLERPLDPSNPVSGTFFSLAENLRDRDSDIPLVILDTIGETLPGTNTTNWASTNVVFFDVDSATGRSSIENGIVDYLGRGGIRARGTSTGGQIKPNLAFETWGPTGSTPADDFDVGLGAFAPESDWVLHAPYDFDRALIRNQFTFAMSNEVGRWAPGTRAVEVYLNRGNGVVEASDYAGVYVLMEKIKRGADRVDIASMSPEVATEPDISGGYIWKIDRTDPGQPGFSAGGQTLNWVYPKSPKDQAASDDQKATLKQEAWVQNYFNEFRDALAHEETRDLHNPDGYAKYLDVAAAVDYSWLNVLAKNVDSLGLSTYLYKDRNGKIEYGPFWDCDRCMESTDPRDDNPLEWGGNYFTFRWWQDMFRDPSFWQAYVDRWTEVRRDKISNDGLDDILDRLAAEVAESSSRDLARWGQTPRSTSPFESGKLNGTWEGEVEHLRQWLHTRAEFMDSNFAARPSVFVGKDLLPDDINGLHVDPSTQISMTGPVGDLFDDTYLVSSDAETSVKYFVPTDDTLGETWAQVDFDDRAWPSGPTGLGVGDDFAEFIRTRVEPKAVQQGATTILARYEFELSDLQDVKDNLLQLRVKYDDGFVAYLNGTEMDRVNLRDSELSWNSRAKAFPKTDAVRFHDFEISEFRDRLVRGKNVLGIRVINSSASSGDILLLPELVTRGVRVGPNPNGAVYYTTDGTDPRGRDGMPTASAILSSPGVTFDVNENVRITARYFDDVTDRGFTSSIVGTDWSGLTVYDFVVEASPLVISEINYHPLPPTEIELQAIPHLTENDFEFLEIYNPSPTPVSLIGTKISDGVEFDFIASSVSSLEAGERMIVASNRSAFELRYGNHHQIAGEYSGNLNNGGEKVDLIDGSRAVLFSVDYNDNDPWPIRADGNGASLALIDPDNTPRERASKYDSWRASREVGGSPGTAGQDPVGVVINEVLAHTDGVNLTDSIELYNPTNAPVVIGGWFLSDSTNDFFKFQIPDGTVLGAGEYQVFDERDFNPTPQDRAPKHFALSGDQGDSVWLVIPAGDQVGSFVDDVHFRETSNGVSMGRLPNGAGRLTPLAMNSFGTDNGLPTTPSVAITELNYNPAKPSEAALAVAPLLSRNDLEFLEIFNASDKTADLTNWRLRGGVDFNFENNTMLDSGESLIVVKFNPENSDHTNRLKGFRAHYKIDESVRILGGYSGQLNDDTGKVLLLRASDSPVDRPDFIPRVHEDEVIYDDLEPWPAGTDGTGNSLQRLAATVFGNDASSWISAAATPGEFLSSVPGDFDGSGIVDEFDIGLLFVQLRSNDPNLEFDLTGDSLVDNSDRDRLVQIILGTNYGDSNLDGKFGTGDLVQVFRAGEYEDDIELNSIWEDGDWDGNGEFDTGDLVLAFQAGGFVEAAQATDEGNSLSAAMIEEALDREDFVKRNRRFIDDFVMQRDSPLKLEFAHTWDLIFRDGFTKEFKSEFGEDELVGWPLDDRSEDRISTVS